MSKPSKWGIRFDFTKINQKNHITNKSISDFNTQISGLQFYTSKIHITFYRHTIQFCILQITQSITCQTFYSTYEHK